MYINQYFVVIVCKASLENYKSLSLLSPTIKPLNLFIKFEIIATVIKSFCIYCDLMNSYMKVNAYYFSVMIKLRLRIKLLYHLISLDISSVNLEISIPK